MNEERDQRLAAMFESNDVDLNGEKFVMRIHRRVARASTLRRVSRGAFVLVLAGIGVFYAPAMERLIIGAQASIEGALVYALGNSLGTRTTEFVVALVVIGALAWRRVRPRD